MEYGETQAQQTQQQQQQVAAQQDQYQDYPEPGYNYPGDMWANQRPNDQAAQVRQAIFEIEKMPSTDKEWQSWSLGVAAAIDAVARIPGIDSYDIDKLNRKFKFLINRANSQGCKAIVESRMQEFQFLLRSYVAKGDVPLPGLTGVGAMITTHTNQKQEIRYPTQPQAGFGLLDMIPFVGRRR
jgi:hypothetical protein